MSLRKLTAGDGYDYLIGQVAVHDSTERGHASLAEYYSQKGEAPGDGWGPGSLAWTASTAAARSPRSR